MTLFQQFITVAELATVVSPANPVRVAESTRCRTCTGCPTSDVWISSTSASSLINFPGSPASDTILSTVETKSLLNDSRVFTSVARTVWAFLIMLLTVFKGAVTASKKSLNRACKVSSSSNNCCANSSGNGVLNNALPVRFSRKLMSMVQLSGLSASWRML